LPVDSYAKTKPGSYELTKENVGTRYAYLIIRTFMDADSTEDIKEANVLQDAIKIEGGGTDLLDIPHWNVEQMLQARNALNTLTKLGASNVGAFGTKQETDPIKHLLFAAAGWGGLPLKKPLLNSAQYRETMEAHTSLMLRMCLVMLFGL
jgi:hypothetical protein